ncbi:SprT family protein [Lacticaseibacillus mingshuiensis]|uniref:SprT family protein n=1 Tax=Lacticaseibacillus mingshuiensis TaxID=2799574 RepID=A0ABW4CG43_9LACO|nr:SprT family protein [Lacticaseibacillus mingshuiensis]
MVNLDGKKGVTIPQSNSDLQALVSRTSLLFFKLPFQHHAVFNARLRTTGGRFHLPDENLDFNPTLFAAIDAAAQIGVIKHELCHYHLYRAHRGFRHGDADFKQLLAAVGGSRFAPALPNRQPRYLYRCQQCGMDYPRQRRIDTRRYGCGQCHGKLKLFPRRDFSTK